MSKLVSPVPGGAATWRVSDGGRERSRSVAYDRPFRQEKAPTKDVHLKRPEKSPENYVDGDSGILRRRKQQRE